MGADAADTINAEPEVIDGDQVDDLVQPLPDANPAAIAVEQAPQPAAASDAPPKPDEPKPAAPVAAAPLRTGAAARPAKSVPAPVDMHGRPFDPLIHETNDDGTPVISTSGKRMGKIRCRRQPLKEYKSTSSIGDEPAPEATAVDPAAPAAPDAAAIALQRKAAAATLTGCQIMLMRVALGESIADSDPERDGLIEAWEGVLAHHGVEAFNPWIGLAICTGGVVLAKINHKETRSRLQRLAEWAKVRAYALWLRVTGRRAAAAPKREPKGEAPDESSAEAPTSAAA